MAETNAQKAVKGATDKLVASATVIKDSSLQQEVSADRRTVLAANRTILAVERTYATWVMAGLGSLGFGIGAKALLQGVVASWLVSTAGSLIILFSGLCFVAAVWRELIPGAPRPEPDIRRIPLPLLLAINGTLLLISLAALIGIWTVRA
ncbi:MAG: DUF202 domain-containing protein [Pseudomonadota bacterium]